MPSPLPTIARPPPSTGSTGRPVSSTRASSTAGRSRSSSSTTSGTWPSSSPTSSATRSAWRTSTTPPRSCTRSRGARSWSRWRCHPGTSGPSPPAVGGSAEDAQLLPAAGETGGERLGREPVAKGLAGAPRETRAEPRVGDGAGEHGGQGLRITWRDQEAVVPVGDVLEDAVDAGGDDGGAGLEGFEERQRAAGFLERGQREHVRAAQVDERIGHPAGEHRGPSEVELGGEALMPREKLSPAGDARAERHAGAAELGERAQEHVHALARVVP